MQQFRPAGFALIPPVVKNLLIINVIMYLATLVFENNFRIDLTSLLGLHYFESSQFHYYQFLTYLFMHGSFSHLFFNMFAVWMFGASIENLWGGKKFLIFYLITGFGAGIIHYGIMHWELSPIIHALSFFANDPNMMNFEAIRNDFPDLLAMAPKLNHYYMQLQQMPENSTLLTAAGDAAAELADYFKDRPVVVGASGSLFGILLAFGMLFPNTVLFMLFLPIPIKAKYFVMIYGAIELYSGFQNNPGDNVAHFAHLGGMLFGFLLIKLWSKGGHKYDQYV